MFEITNKKNKQLIIYRTPLLDAAKCSSGDNEPDIAREAGQSINHAFHEMKNQFENGGKVRLQYVKAKGSDGVEFGSMNQFKVWLIRNQSVQTYRLLLEMLKEYCKKNNCPFPRLNITFGSSYKEQIYNTDMYFRNTYDPKWLENEVVKKLIQSVDKSRVINQNAIESPVFGTMPPEKLSGGVKTLILIYNNPECVFNASTCGDNCAKWIERFSKEKDFVINLYHTMIFSNKNFEAYVLNGDEIIHSYEEYIELSDKYCRK